MRPEDKKEIRDLVRSLCRKNKVCDRCFHHPAEKYSTRCKVCNQILAAQRRVRELQG